MFNPVPINTWIKNNKWSLETPFRVAFNMDGPISSILRTCYQGQLFTRIRYFKKIFPKMKISVWISGRDSANEIDLLKTHKWIDNIQFRYDESIFKMNLKSFILNNANSQHTGLVIYETNKWKRIYDSLRFPIDKWTLWTDFLTQNQLELEWFKSDPLLPNLTDDDLNWVAKNFKIDKSMIGISFFSSYPLPSKKTWDDLINLILSKGFGIVFFGNYYEKIKCKNSINKLEQIYIERAWTKDCFGEYYQSILKRNDMNIKDMVGIAPDIRKLLAVMKSCVAHITVSSGLCQVPWIYQIPSVIVQLQTKEMLDNYINRKDGYFWGITDNKSNGTRLVIQESDKNAIDIAEKIWKKLVDNTDFLDSMSLGEKR